MSAANAASGPLVDDRREGERRLRERRRARLPAPVEGGGEPDDDGAPGRAADPAAAPAKPARPPSSPPAAFAAQVLGQPGQKRGLKAGTQALDAARATYLGREYSGPHDRRPPPGRARKTEI